jgi:ABC-type branched-subunit amino acid transport system ATPase component
LDCCDPRKEKYRSTIVRSPVGVLTAFRGWVSAMRPRRSFFSPISLCEENLLIAHLSLTKFSTCCDRVFALFPVLGEKLSQAAGTLSGGEQRMLAIGRALLNFPNVFILGEISEGLSPAVLDTIELALRLAQRENPLAILMVERNISFGLRVASSYAVMNRGSIVVAGDIESERINVLHDEVAEHLRL